MKFRGPKRSEPAIGLDDPPVHMLLRPLAHGVVSVVDTPPVGQVHAQQQTRGLVVVARFAVALNLQVAEARLVVAVLDGSGLSQPVAQAVAVAPLAAEALGGDVGEASALVVVLVGLQQPPEPSARRARRPAESYA